MALPDDSSGASDTGGTSALGTWTWARALATSWNEPACLPGSPVTILDPNVHVLDHASRRLQRLDITAVEADVCKPLPVDGTFDSAALHGVIHCLPGPLSRKAVAVANVAAVLAPTGVLFGASILGPSGPHTWLSRMILDANNRRGIFDNLGDTQDGLREILEASFEQVELETVGSMACCGRSAY